MDEPSSTHRGVTGEHTTAGVPHGATSLTPFLALRGAAEAVEFYRTVIRRPRRRHH